MSYRLSERALSSPGNPVLEILDDGFEKASSSITIIFVVFVVLFGVLSNCRPHSICFFHWFEFGGLIIHILEAQLKVPRNHPGEWGTLQILESVEELVDSEHFLSLKLLLSLISCWKCCSLYKNQSKIFSSAYLFFRFGWVPFKEPTIIKKDGKRCNPKELKMLIYSGKTLRVKKIK